MKTTRKLWDNKALKWKQEEVDICDVAGTLLEEGQTVWYARAEKSAASELYKGKIVKLTPNSVSVEYDNPYYWRQVGTMVGRLTACRYTEGQCRYHQIVVIRE